MRVVVVTVVHGRHEHLARQLEALDASETMPRGHVVVAIDEPDLAGVTRLVEAAQIPSRICNLQTGERALPIGPARNVGARGAIDDGADLLVFVDVDCIPAPGLIRRYVEASLELPDALLSGPVAYLEPPPPGGYVLSALVGAPGHPARPVPAEDTIVRGADHRLFWSLSFAVTAATWLRLGGFCEQYLGYGGEDTDFGQIAAQRAIEHVWVGGAWAYHQHHPVKDPPEDRVVDIVRNANIFHDRWGWWPMGGWLTAFAERGLAHLKDGQWECADGPPVTTDSTSSMV